MKILILMLAALLGCIGGLTPVIAADVAVIVNKANENKVDKAFITKIYLGEQKSWGDGSAISAVDLPEDNPVRASFSSEVLGKSVANMKALWAQFTFSGKAVPPKVMSSDDDVKKAVSSSKNAIGYIKSSSLDDSVKAVLK